MEQRAPIAISPLRKPKSFYHARFLVLLWAIFTSVLVGYVTPQTNRPGYQPVHARTEVKGVSTTASRVESPKKVGFITEEIEAVKVVPTHTSTPTPTKIPSKPTDDKKYSKSRQIGEYTWTVDVSDDDHSATEDEIYQALNNYRQKNGKGSLSLDARLSSFARSRADAFAGQGKTDSHAGFTDYINNQDGFTKLGFMKLGENSSFGYKVSGTKLIEEVYGGDSPHDSNQLGDWSHVGIGVNGLGTNLIFASQPL